MCVVQRADLSSTERRRRVQERFEEEHEREREREREREDIPVLLEAARTEVGGRGAARARNVRRLAVCRALDDHDEDDCEESGSHSVCVEGARRRAEANADIWVSSKNINSAPSAHCPAAATATAGGGQPYFFPLFTPLK